MRAGAAEDADQGETSDRRPADGGPSAPTHLGCRKMHGVLASENKVRTRSTRHMCRKSHVRTVRHDLRGGLRPVRQPSSRALRTARVRSRTPSLPRTLDAWFLTVPSEVPSASAISRLLYPPAM